MNWWINQFWAPSLPGARTTAPHRHPCMYVCKYCMHVVFTVGLCSLHVAYLPQSTVSIDQSIYLESWKGQPTTVFPVRPSYLLPVLPCRPTLLFSAVTLCLISDSPFQDRMLAVCLPPPSLMHLWFELFLSRRGPGVEQAHRRSNRHDERGNEGFSFRISGLSEYWWGRKASFLVNNVKLAYEKSEWYNTLRARHVVCHSCHSESL